MTITLETLKAHEANILAQLGQVQGALAYNRQLQQEAMAVKPEQQPKTEDDPPAEPNVPIK